MERSALPEKIEPPAARARSEIAIYYVVIIKTDEGFVNAQQSKRQELLQEFIV